eukprot:TRINITY_DN169_c0_g1_i1.p1 TRINITY_DN169_c0_g1~~TRINITY_DN169_c0_g1_i1.p1  ORF type:complete len:191 (-),score=106.25 TRINITY_DN169_c0_g1_i1:87-659(-)
MIRRPPRSTQSRSSAASDVYKRQVSTQSTWEFKIIQLKYLMRQLILIAMFFMAVALVHSELTLPTEESKPTSIIQQLLSNSSPKERGDELVRTYDGSRMGIYCCNATGYILYGSYNYRPGAKNWNSTGTVCDKSQASWMVGLNKSGGWHVVAIVGGKVYHSQGYTSGGTVTVRDFSYLENYVFSQWWYRK